jgi:hypothetical protein
LTKRSSRKDSIEQLVNQQPDSAATLFSASSGQTFTSSLSNHNKLTIASPLMVQRTHLQEQQYQPFANQIGLVQPHQLEQQHQLEPLLNNQWIQEIKPTSNGSPHAGEVHQGSLYPTLSPISTLNDLQVTPTSAHAYWPVTVRCVSSVPGAKPPPDHPLTLEEMTTQQQQQLHPEFPMVDSFAQPSPQLLSPSLEQLQGQSMSFQNYTPTYPFPLSVDSEDQTTTGPAFCTQQQHCPEPQQHSVQSSFLPQCCWELP